MTVVAASTILTAVVTTAVNLYLQERAPPAKDVVLATVPSAVLGEPRPIIVHLPWSYPHRPERRYPVVYVLDGSSQDGHTARAAALMARIGVMPEVLVVGLPNTSGASRQRDYTPPFMGQDADQAGSPPGAGDVFLRFLRTELVPQVERDYRAGPFRAIAGRSRGGLLVLYSLIADPTLFQARFAFSTPAWRQDQVLVAKLREGLASQPDLDGFLYLSAGARETERMIRGHHGSVAALRQQAPPGLRWSGELTPGADHGDNAELSTPLALRALYEGWRPPAAP